jgi:hypothetical protein
VRKRRRCEGRERERKNAKEVMRKWERYQPKSIQGVKKKTFLPWSRQKAQFVFQRRKEDNQKVYEEQNQRVRREGNVIQNISDHAKRPNVARSVVTGTLEDFWRNVARWTAAGLKDLRIAEGKKVIA